MEVGLGCDGSDVGCGGGNRTDTTGRALTFLSVVRGAYTQPTVLRLTKRIQVPSWFLPFGLKVWAGVMVARMG